MLKIIGEKVWKPNKNGNLYPYVLCECYCGKIVDILYYNALKNISCGCYAKQKLIERSTTHGLTRTPTYNIWAGMMLRCYNKNHKHYDRYGGRGILVCERWHSVENFVEDMGERPIGLSIDRIDNDKGYCKENCRWSSQIEQSRNKSSNTVITIDGITKCLKEWSESENVLVDYETIAYRLRAGWPPKKAIYTKSARDTGKYVGVFLNKNKDKYLARIMVKGKTIRLGVFDTELEAVEARKQAELKFRTDKQQTKE